MKRTLPNRPSRGFTLIEVMITVVIVGILAAVALPAYNKSVMRSQRSVAKGVVMEQAQLLERFYTQAGTFTGGPAVERPSPNGATGNAIRYTVATSITDGATYTVTATPVGGQANDDCGTLSMTNTGAQTAKAGVPNCW